jgi:hypothetical protein
MQVRVAWSPNGEWIAVSDKDSPLSPSRLILIATRSGEKKRLAYDAPKFDADVSPAFSRDGCYLAFARHISPVVADICVLELPRHEGAHAETKQLTNSNRLNRNPLWTAEGQEILFIGGQRSSDSKIWRIPAFRAADAQVIDQLGDGITSMALSLERIVSCTRRDRTTRTSGAIPLPHTFAMCDGLGLGDLLMHLLRDFAGFRRQQHFVDQLPGFFCSEARNLRRTTHASASSLHSDFKLSR